MADNTTRSSEFGEMSEKDYSTYSTIRQSYTEVEGDYSKLMDRMLTTLSGGAIALSLAFLKDIVGDKPVGTPSLLAGAWFFLILSIGLNVVSIYMTPIAFREFRIILDEEASKGGHRFLPRVKLRQDERFETTIIKLLNLLSLATFLIGICLLLFFAYGSVGLKGATNG